MTVLNQTLAKPKIQGELSAQVLGLTDEHIHFFETEVACENKQKTAIRTCGIHQYMLTDYLRLVKAAEKEDINIELASGFRSFERQLNIWNNKFTGKSSIKNIHGNVVAISELADIDIVNAILLYSALPGASRHHWGCDIDIYASNLLGNTPLQLEPWEYSDSGPMAKLSLWLKTSARKYGFYFPYDSYRGGVAAEPWHLSYLPIAQQYQSTFSIETLHALLLSTDIAGKSAIIDNLPYIFKQYINNINSITTE